MDRIINISDEKLTAAAQKFGTPLFLYDENTLRTQADNVLNFPNAYGLTPRFSMKSLPNMNVLRLFNQMGLSIDASSGFEAERAIKIGIAPAKIQITAQEIPLNLKPLINQGVDYVACSLHQLKNFGTLFPGKSLGIRINPGLGSGHSNRTNVGGPASSFGIWFEYLAEIKKTAEEYNLKIDKLHTHIGSGSDPEVWKKVALMTLDVAATLPDVKTVNLGGGFKVARMPDETSADLNACGEAVKNEFISFYEKTNRKLHLEIEPGTYLVARAGAILTEITDKVYTGDNGYTFLKTNSGMTEITRPSLYGAQHPLHIIPFGRTETDTEEVVITGHCCESGDILTPAPGDPEALAPRQLLKAEIGDFLFIEGCGAYCSSMSTKNYNSFPEALEILYTKDHEFKLIRKKQTIDQIIQNEINVVE